MGECQEKLDMKRGYGMGNVAAGPQRGSGECNMGVHVGEDRLDSQCQRGTRHAWRQALGCTGMWAVGGRWHGMVKANRLLRAAEGYRDAIRD